MGEERILRDYKRENERGCVCAFCILKCQLHVCTWIEATFDFDSFKGIQNVFLPLNVSAHVCGSELARGRTN